MIRFYIKRVVTAILLFWIFIILISLWMRALNNSSVRNYLNSFVVPSPEYVVSSPDNCQIINLNPFDKSILKYISKIEPTECSAYPPLTVVSYNPSTTEHTLELIEPSLPYYTNSSGEIKCCVKRFTVNGVINRIVFGLCERFYRTFTMDKSSEFLFVFCLDEEDHIFYQNMHAAVIKAYTPPLPVKTRRENELNVLLIGFDSMSRLNFHRTMPKTAAFLQSHGWVEMQGYNKIADNTLPNLMAVLAGLPPEEFKRAHTLTFEDMPFIWDEFYDNGYATLYAEDTPLVSTFNCHLRGFKRNPTDHYFRDYIYAGELLLMGNGRPPGCIGYKLSSQHMFEYMLDFVTVYKNDPFFGLFWLNQISHNNLNRPSGEDERVLEQLERLVEAGVMNSTMVVLMSDHGLRVGEFRRSYHGWYEDRLPMLFISLPDWYKKQNIIQYFSLLMNSKRLTSPFDLHLTLKHVLNRNASSKVQACRSCRSLLTPVSPNRSCPEAGISPHWCTCHPFFDVPLKNYSVVLAEMVVDSINEKLDNDLDIDSFSVCETLRLRDILYIRKKYKPDVKELIVGIVTEPGGAEFEATVLVNGKSVIVENSISRLNNYGNESVCAENPITKLFCYCLQVV